MGDKKKGFFGSLFDLNGDGKTDLGEQYIAYKIFEDMTEPDGEKAAAPDECDDEHDSIKITIQNTDDGGYESSISYLDDVFDFDIDDTEGWSQEELWEKYYEIDDTLGVLECEEPPEEDEEAYDEWFDKCQQLRDMLDDIEDAIDEF